MSFQPNHTIVRQLRALGVTSGDHLGLGISYKSVGRIEGGPEAFIDSLLEVVSPMGTLLIPTYTPTYPLSWARARPLGTLFDPQNTPAYTGLVPELMRRRQDAIRSRHPTNSMVAIGCLADHFTASHDETAPAYSPYSSLAASEGKVISIGLGDRIVGLRHEAQFLAGLLTQVPLQLGATYFDQKGCLQLFERRDMGGCTARLGELTQELRAAGLVQDGHIGNALATLVSARPSLEYMTSRLKGDPQFFLCANLRCIWCRELERRMNLYERITSPRYFQSNLFIITCIALFNSIRLNQPYWLVRTKLLASSITRKKSLPAMQ